MVYGEITSTAAATAFNCPQIGYSSASGTLPFLASNQPQQFFPTTQHDYNLQPVRGAIQAQSIQAFDFNSPYALAQQDYSTNQESCLQEYVSFIKLCLKFNLLLANPSTS